MTPASPMDQLNDIAVTKDHVVEMMFLPSAWQAATNTSRTWTSLDFPPQPRGLVPAQPGVYAFVVTPDLFDLDSASGLFYVGKATSLRSRIGEYIGEVDSDLNASKRPHVWKMVNRWNGSLKYFYTVTGDVAEAEALETQMIDALLPPFNRKLGATMSVKTRAFG